MTTLDVYDPGRSSGFARLWFTDTTVAVLDSRRQIEGGAAALSDFIQTQKPKADITVSEKYVPLPGKGFHHTLDSVEPLRGEGVLIALGLMPDYPDPKWRRADRMYLHGGKSLAEKRKRSHRYLKESGYYVTGADVGCKDANDVRSAILHGLSYLAQVLNHRPTFDSISSWVERNP